MTVYCNLNMGKMEGFKNFIYCVQLKTIVNRTSGGLTAEYPGTVMSLNKNSVYCILTCSSKNAAKFKQ